MVNILLIIVNIWLLYGYMVNSGLIMVNNRMIIWLVVVLTTLKHMSQWGWDDIPYMKIKDV